jgi:hypothetical protein
MQNEALSLAPGLPGTSAGVAQLHNVKNKEAAFF